MFGSLASSSAAGMSSAINAPATINPSHTVASGHVAATEGSEDGMNGSGSSSSAPPNHGTHNIFSFSIPSSEASLSFGALTAAIPDDYNDSLMDRDQAGSPSKSRQQQQASPAQTSSDAADLAALGPAPLRRNQACLSCRKRKLRCDATRPVCATCARSRAAAAAANHPSPVPLGDCVYDDVAPTGKKNGDSSKPRTSDSRSGGGPRKSSNSVSASTPAAMKEKAKDDRVVVSPAIPIAPQQPANVNDNLSRGEGTSPESIISVSSSIPRAPKRKKRDDGTAQAAEMEVAGSSALYAAAMPAPMGVGGGPPAALLTAGIGAGAGGTAATGARARGATTGGTGDLEKQMREVQLEDRIHHLEMLLVQSMSRNEQIQAHYSRLQQPLPPQGSAGATALPPFTAQNTSAFNAATLASAGIPSAACAFSEAQASAPGLSNSGGINGSQAMSLDPASAFDASRVFSPTAASPSQASSFGSVILPPHASGGFQSFTAQDDTNNSIVSAARMNFGNHAFGDSSMNSLLAGAIPPGIDPGAVALVGDDRIEAEINVGHGLGGEGQSVPQPDPFLELLWPGWPKDLPSPDTLHHLAEIFFAKCPLRGMLNKGQFMAGLLLPPRHPNRPHEALLHAVLAVAAPMSPHFKSKRSNPLAGGVCSPRASHQTMGTFSDPECVVPMVGDPHRRQDNLDPSQLSFADFHLSQARLKIEVSMRTSTRNPIHWLQASILGAYLLWADARFVEGFMLSGVLSRAAAPVGLFKLQSRHTAEPQIPASLLAPPSSAAEEHERRTLMWYVYLNDVYQSGAGLYWEPVIDDAAIQTSLPVPMMQWQAGLDPPPNHQVLTSPDLFTSNHMDDFILHIKSGVILKRVQLFIARNNITMFTTKRPAGFRALDNTINEFLASFTGSHHLEFGPDVTMDRLLSYSNVMLSTILLHENFVSLSDRTSYSNVRTEQATKAVLQTIYELLASSFDFNLLHPYIYMAWTIAARMICRELTWQRIFGEAKVADEVAQALDTVIEALHRAGDKHLVATRSALLLDRFRQGHWSEEMLSGSIFIDGVLPGEDKEESNTPAAVRSKKVTAPTQPGQPVHYYPLLGNNDKRGGDGTGSGAGVGQAGTASNGSGSGNGNSNGGGTSDVAQQLAAAAAAAFANWMPELNNDAAMRTSSDPFIAGGGGSGNSNAAQTPASSGGGGGGMMQMSPAAADQPSTPWNLMNILVPEQEGLD
ncbi:hypothetical protein CF319_g3866 [Tilletia indica]|nr:hypothetical protein CF319_g3866 [Tilletia indica]KAE8231551.1 hypothetical protein CF326_g3430 [Tilletia indica]